MLKQVIIVSIISILLTIFFGDKATTVISTLFSATFLSNTRKSSTSEKLLTAQELQLFNGIDKQELYLSFLGLVYDVSKGRKHYGPGAPYNVFIGRDASRNFVTGEFKPEDISDQVSDLNDADLRSLRYWIDFYRKEYPKVGKLIGTYYDDDAKMTPYGAKVKELIIIAEKNKVLEEKEKDKLPGCNIEWDPEKGTKVWCTKQSGGVKRSWIGVPRKLYEPGADDYRCACISEENKHLGNTKEYENCDKESDTCYIKK